MSHSPAQERKQSNPTSVDDADSYANDTIAETKLNSSLESQLAWVRAKSKRRWCETLESSNTPISSLEEIENEKEKAIGSTSKIPCSEVRRYFSMTCDGATAFASDCPIKLFTSNVPLNDNIDLSSSHSNAPPPSHSSSIMIQRYCRTLREFLGFEGPEAKHAPILWMVVFNYLIDFEYLLDLVPELISIPNMVIFYGHGDPQSWKKMNPNIYFQQLVPSDPPKTSTNPLPYRIPWGVHHTKMFLIGFGDGTLRVIIHTANLLPGDVSLKAQGAYVQDFPRKINPTSEPSSAFESDLITYLQSYKFNQRRNWSGEIGATRSLCDELRQYSFQSAKVILIPSTPGRISMRDDPKLGYLKLSQSIRKCVPKTSSSMPIICQFSSIGSLSMKWLSELSTAWDAAQLDVIKEYPKDEILPSTSRSRGLQKQQRKLQSLQQNLMLIYPTVTEIRDSVEGYAGGGSVPGRRSNLHKPFLLPLYCRWSSPSPRHSLSSSGSPNPLHKPLNVPHIKTYYQISQDELGMDWFCITSHNLSKAAWGEIIQTQQGLQFFTRHWELGVFLAPSLFSKEKLRPAATLNSISNDENILYVPLPFELRPSKYNTEDHPWAIDGTYSIPDRLGQHDCIQNRSGS